MTRLDPRHVRQAQRFARDDFDALRAVEKRSEAEQDRHEEYARDAAEDARIDYESEEL